MVTIKDIAKKAGLSIASVSYALNNKEGVTPETRKRIKELAADMGYVPNSLAKGLQSRKTGIIGLILPELSNIYTSSFLEALNTQARGKGFFILLGNTFYNDSEEIEIINSFISKKVDALIIVPHNNHNSSMYNGLVERAQKNNIQVVFTNLELEHAGCAQVLPDFVKGSYTLTQYVLRRGCKKLLFAGGTRSHYYSRMKIEGFTKALLESEIELNPDMIQEFGTDYSYQDGYTFIQSFFEKNGSLPDAIIAVNDLVAYGIIQRLSEAGIKIPQDVSVAGYDNLPLPVPLNAKLTTVHIPLEEMAHRCLSIISGKSSGMGQAKHLLPVHLVEGETVI